MVVSLQPSCLPSGRHAFLTLKYSKALLVIAFQSYKNFMMVVQLGETKIRHLFIRNYKSLLLVVFLNKERHLWSRGFSHRHEEAENCYTIEPQIAGSSALDLVIG
jgi:hypothetical protein